MPVLGREEGGLGWLVGVGWLVGLGLERGREGVLEAVVGGGGGRWWRLVEKGSWSREERRWRSVGKGSW